MDFIVVSLFAKIKELENDSVATEKLKATLSSFKCSKSDDEQRFLRDDAFDYDVHNKARTYLIILDNKIIGYFTLAIKSLDFVDGVNKTKKKRIMGADGGNIKTYSGYLIGHIAKDDSYNKEISPFIFDQIFRILQETQSAVGGRIVYLDCKDEIKLKELYSSFDFKYLQTSPASGLLQYYRKL